MRIQKMLFETSALLEGHFQLSSGLHSDKYVQCAILLSYPELARESGDMLAQKLIKYSPDIVVSPAVGGIVIGQEVANALNVRHFFAEKENGKPVLRRGFKVKENMLAVVVEDVVTTGLSVNEVCLMLEENGVKTVAIGSIINRSGKENPFSYPFEYLLKIGLEVYKPEECPLCKEGIPLEKPGSRK